ncbi:MAG: shikimate dehydrogenase [Actinomycetota bacterium]|nr:shikimate dehydrogenase [Actinomycetota bacterium]
MSLNGPAGIRRLAVLGHPVSHSRSPVMQNAALADLGLDAGWEYEAIDVEPERFSDFVRGMEYEGFAGANVTVPHKEAAIALADEATAAAKAIGAANTLSFASGRILADNTDAPGLIDSLPSSPDGSKALLLGAGGAARAVLWALVTAGADVSVWNRTRSRAESLTEELGGTVVEKGFGGSGGREFDLIVNSSAAGLGDTDGLGELPLGTDSFRPGQVVVDMVYGKTAGTLLTAAREAGADTVDGLEILVRQGARSFALWTGRDPSLDVMRAAARG